VEEEEEVMVDEGVVEEDVDVVEVVVEVVIIKLKEAFQCQENSLPQHFQNKS
jgi:hypothetical protein